MKTKKSSWLFFSAGAILFILLCVKTLLPFSSRHKLLNKKRSAEMVAWKAPDTADIPKTKDGELIRYGRELIAHTSKFLGPKGEVSKISNGMNCQNCHIDAGTVPFGNAFFAVAATYPKFRPRSGKIESIEFRINECMERSLNGHKLDSQSKEMRAMVEYIRWLGKDVKKDAKLEGIGTEELPFLDRPADAEKGRAIFISRCQNCHGKKGEGSLASDSASYLYPPLWGKNSYTVSAGMYRLSRLAGFIRNNMPLYTSYKKPVLSIEEAWDVAALINDQFHPKKFFDYDWPKISTKPIDYPFGPYTDSFSEQQHKLGPFGPIKKKKEMR